MNWISFLWGVGVMIIINVVSTIFVLPKPVERMNNMEKSLKRSEVFLSGYEETIKSLLEERDEVLSYLERLQASIKLRKSCPSCGTEFPLYVVEEKPSPS